MSHHHAHPAHKRSDSVHEHPMSGPPRKRVTLACNACRTKRIKCDGDETSCSACSQRGEQCQYDSAGSKRTRVSNAYIHALEARVQALETALNLRDEKTMRLTKMIGSQGTGRTAVSHAPMSTTEGQTDVDSLADALGCFTVGDTGELRFFGTSSNFSIIRHHTLRVASSTDARRAGIEAAHKMTDFVQPSNETRDHLLELYWKWQNSWQYIVARESFVEDLYVTQSAKYCTPLLLYAMLALSCRFSDREELRTDPEDANTAGEAFATQARLMLHYECEAPTTSTVQAAAILGLYSAAIDREGHGFMYIGMASRMAMNLGLHSDCSAYVEKGLISREDAEARKIAFWGVYVLDKLYCVGMGRPAGILEWNITTMKPAAEDRPTPMLSAQQSMISHPWQTSLITENAMQMCSIFIITSAVIDQLYAQKPEWSEIEKYERIMDTHLNLVKWHEALPKRLRISDSSDKPAPPFVYQMHLQHHVSLILLHRPYFRVLYNGPSSGIYDPSCEDIHSKTCHEAAIKISNILRIFRHNYTNRCSPVSAVHPALTAGIIHLLELTTADPAGQSRAARHLKICLSSLYEMNLNWAWASRSIRALQSLAVEWGVGDWLPTLLGGIPEDNLAHFAEYERSCVEVATMPLAEIFQPQQQAWPQDTFDVWQHGPFDDNILDILGSDWCEPAA